MFGIVVIGLFVIFSYGVGNVAAASGDTVYVNGSSGSDAYNGLNSTWITGTLNGPKATIKNATGTVTTNGTIYIAKGTYNESNIQINTNMTIIGENQKNTIINGKQSGYSIFTIESGANLTIANLTLTNGTSDTGGAIYSEGTLNVENCTFTNNTATYQNGDGGAIFNDGTLTVTKSTFNKNTANYGGAIWNNGNNSTLTNNTFTNNTANDGGAIYNEHTGTVIVTNNTFTNNTANDGGAIFSYGTSTVTNNTFNNNTADSLMVPYYGYGGAIYTLGTSTETNNTFNNNIGIYGGAIYNQGTLTETNSTFNSNTAREEGGAISNGGILTETKSTFNNNSAVDGGAISNFGNLIVKDSNFTNNAAINNGGAILDSFALNVTGSNFTDNTAGQGGAVYIDNSPTYTVNINFNRIIENTSNSYELYSYGNRVVNATLNWWGSNTSPKNKISGTGVTYDPWIVLTVKSNHSTIDIGDNSTVTADLIHDNGGNYLNPVNGHVPDGMLVNFTGDVLGNINPKSVTTLDGSSPTSFTGVAIGISEVSATVDDQTVTTNITINKIPTTIAVKSINGYNGKTVNLTATLIDSHGNLLTDQTVTFKINGHVYSTTTNNNGLATIEYVPHGAGNYDVTVNYLGNSNYTASNGTGLLNINPSADLYLQITSSNKNPKSGEIFTLTYKLGNKGPDNATNVIISIPLPETFEIANISGNGNWTYNKATSTITWTLTNVTVGDHYLYITGKFNSSGAYVFGSTISSKTYDPNTSGVDPITVIVSGNNTNTTTSTNPTTTAKDLTTTIPMQHTGLPITGLILAILTVLGGSIMSRKK